jgi:hypothetical protein
LAACLFPLTDQCGNRAWRLWVSHLGRVRLAKLTPERIEAYRDQYLLGKDDSGRGLISRALARKVLVSLKSMLRSAKVRTSRRRHSHCC